MTIHDALSAGEVQVTFEKADGSIRVMRATVRMDLISYSFKGTPVDHTDKPGLMRVWDLDKAAWRSIKADRIIGWAVAELDPTVG